jgi:hypothetical protein
MSRLVTTNNLHSAGDGKEFVPEIDKRKTSYVYMHISPRQNSVTKCSVRDKCRERKSEPSGCSTVQSASQSVALGDVTFLASPGNQCTCDDLAWLQGVSLSWGYHSSMPVAATTYPNSMTVCTHRYKLRPSGSMAPCRLVIACRRCGGTI